ncbi:SpoIID/LytB domain-containing protein [Muricomes intestini]|uniref:Stage II sporulation protein D n=1 Tax=Muricomes intestini TaxID=1796634 RepID=A0A4R3K9B8_9FIRM|nr:SpoIID/LytB domain-containing protein [Muricomes intestini]TCS79485.1 stage II sporulation protein D [Muricomes intestini]HCR84167.1 stage II sporulation protein D [Lachnospiraceae bacterium]
MGQRYMKQKFKMGCSFLIILILLPYVVTVFVNGGDMKAAGKEGRAFVRVKNTSADSKEKALEVPWDEYFTGVLAKEMPAAYEMEALKAQAVLIRTHLYQMLDSSEDKILEDSYLSSKELEKKWGAKKYDTYQAKLKKAMDETSNEVLYYNDTYAMVPFHQSSNGKTRNGQEVLGSADYPYLVVRDCPEDKKAEDEMHVYSLGYKEIQSKCQPFLVAVDKESAEKTYQFSDFEIQEYDSAGYVSKLRIGDTVCSGEQFREALSLSSSSFTLQEADGGLRITTVGVGHGLGMSQWTANEMAKQGKSYEEILQNFFEGTNLTDGGEIFAKIE